MGLKPDTKCLKDLDYYWEQDRILKKWCDLKRNILDQAHEVYII